MDNKPWGNMDDEVKRAFAEMEQQLSSGITTRKLDEQLTRGETEIILSALRIVMTRNHTEERWKLYQKLKAAFK